MIASNGGPQRARWNVIWTNKEGEIEDEAFGSDFASALTRYTDGVKQGDKNITLHSGNMGFEPPQKYRDGEVKKFRVKGTKKVVSRTIPTEPPTWERTMTKFNMKGWWWCPFCAKMRRFERVNGFEVEGIFVREAAMICPICGVSHNHGTVARWNPHASRITMRLSRSDKGTVRG